MSPALHSSVRFLSSPARTINQLAHFIGRRAYRSANSQPGPAVLTPRPLGHSLQMQFAWPVLAKAIARKHWLNRFSAHRGPRVLESQGLVRGKDADKSRNGLWHRKRMAVLAALCDQTACGTAQLACWRRIRIDARGRSPNRGWRAPIMGIGKPSLRVPNV